MSTQETNALKEFENANTETTSDRPQGGDTVDNSYATSGKEPVPVLKDEAPVQQPNDEIDPGSDKVLERDEQDAIDKDNILKGDRLHQVNWYLS